MKMRKWFYLALFCYCNLIVALYQYTFSPLVSPLTVNLGISDNSVAALSYLIYGLYTPVTFFSIYFLSKSLRLGLVVGCCFMIIAAWVRYFGCKSYVMLILGQVFTGLSMPFIVNATTDFSETWFPPNQRSIATTLGSISNIMGGMVAYLWSPTIINTNKQAKQPSIEFEKSFSTLLLIQALLASFGCVLLIVFFREKQHSLNSIRATYTALPLRTYIAFFRECFSNVQFIALLFGAGTVYGSFCGLVVLVVPLLEPLQFTEAQSSLCSALNMAFGLAFVLVISPIVDKYRCYQPFLKLGLAWLCASSLLLVIFLYYVDCTPMIYVCFALLGAMAVPCLPVGLELGVELTYPVPECASNGLIMMSGNLFGLICILVMQVYIDYAAWIMFAFIAIPLPFVFLIKMEYKRLAIENDYIPINGHNESEDSED